MSKQSEHTKFENRTAEECRAVANAHARALKDFWKRFAVSGLFVIAVVVIIFASLAWFASNNRVNAATSTISAKAARFSIEGVSGDSAADVGYYERSSTASESKPKTLQSTDSMKVSASFNLNNYNGGSLRPGSSGELQITVTPVAKNVGTINISLERIVEKRSADSSSTSDSGDASASPTASELEDLFRGHIVFFKTYANGYYADPVLDDALNIDPSEFYAKDADGNAISSETTEPVTITLYWVWPSQFSSFVLTGKINYNPNLFESTGSVGYSDVLASINASRENSAADGSKAQYYRDEDGGTANIAGLPAVSSDMSAANLQACAEAYNHADEVLGTYAAFLQIRFTAEEALS